jgi:hypothetical protein
MATSYPAQANTSAREGAQNGPLMNSHPLRRTTPTTSESVSPIREDTLDTDSQTGQDLSHSNRVYHQSNEETQESGDGRHSTENTAPPSIKTPPVETAQKQTENELGEKRMDKGKSNISRLDIYDPYILILGTLSLTGAFGYLLFLWLGNANNPTWNKIVLTEYVSQSVTLSALVIRTAVVFQTATCSAMIAAIVMEKHGVRASASVSWLFTRTRGRDPVMLLLDGIFDRSAWLCLSFTCLLAATTLVTQFTSTILVSDLGLAPFITSKQTSDFAYGLSSAKKSLIGNTRLNLTSTSPLSFPSFAEVSVPPFADDRVDDTGLNLRALLPIASGSTRESLASYTGYATLLNSRTVCVRPRVADGHNITYNAISGSETVGAPGKTVSGALSLERSTLPPGLTSFGSDSNLVNPSNFVEFSCSLSTEQLPNEWPVSICTATGRMEVVVSSPLNDGTLTGTSMFVVMNHSGDATIPNAYVTGVRFAQYVSIQSANWTATSRGNWLNLHSNDALDHTDLSNLKPLDFSVQLSLCFASFDTADVPVHVLADSNRTEPALRSRRVETGFNGTNIDASSVMEQMLAGKTNSSEPGSLLLQVDDSNGPNGNRSSSLDMDIGYTDIQQTFGLCTFCGSSSTEISLVQAAIFQQTLKEAGSIATALQTLFTIVSSMNYYNRCVENP